MYKITGKCKATGKQELIDYNLVENEVDSAVSEYRIILAKTYTDIRWETQRKPI